VHQPPTAKGRPTIHCKDQAEDDNAYRHGHRQRFGRRITGDTEDDQDDGHDREWGQQDILGGVKPPKNLIAVQGSEGVAVLKYSPAAHRKLITADEAEQTSDDGEIYARSHIRAFAQPIVEPDWEEATLHEGQEGKEED